MQMLREARRSLNLLGFNQKLEPFNLIVLCICVFIFLCVSSQWIFLFFEADSAHEYMESIYIVCIPFLNYIPPDYYLRLAWIFTSFAIKSVQFEN